MRLSVFPALLVSAVIGFTVGSCDLLDDTVLIDNGEKITEIDSTKIRVLSSVADSTQLIINTTADWTAQVQGDVEWCRISKKSGVKGTDTIRIYVTENTKTKVRKTSIAIEAGQLTKVYWVTQSAAEEWLDLTYWNRTVAQRLGLHGKVDTMKVTDNWHPDDADIYVFDIRGNLLEHKVLNDTFLTATRTYTYDQSNHRLTCSVKDFKNTEVRSWRYEYHNTDKYVAYSALWWSEEIDPLAEEMEGMIVPDLSAVYKTWTENGTEFHEDRIYNFEGEYKLVISVERWKDSLGVRVPMSSDTIRVSNNYFSGCRLSLPHTSRANVVNTAYYTNGMLKMMQTADYTYEFVENSQRLIVKSFNYTGSGAHEIDSYECEYNAYHELTERRIKYSGTSEVSIDLYPEYQYDDKFNWILRNEETAKHDRYTRRTITYYN